jgi:transketolase
LSTRVAHSIEDLISQQRRHFEHWQVIQDCVDQNIDMMLNYRQSGHPGGSRSKVQTMIALTLSGAMRWDIRHPELSFSDRFVLIAGHCTPLIYALMPVYNESLRYLLEQTGDERYAVPMAEQRQLVWEDLLDFRHRGGLAGHAEMEGKTLFYKANTGPSGHGAPPAAGIAMALVRAGLKDIRVFGLEGEGGHSAGAHHETKNSAYGLGLENLHYLIDWNDYGIDSFAHSSVVYGSPEDWFRPYGFRIAGAENGADFEQVTKALLSLTEDADKQGRPAMAWMKTRKGRDYGKFDYSSHGAPHKLNSTEYWETKREFMERYDIEFEGFGQSAPADPNELRTQVRNNLEKVAQVLRGKTDTVEYLANRLIEVGDTVPRHREHFALGSAGNPASDAELFDYENFPAELWASPGSAQPNRAGLSNYGAWMNSRCKEKYGRPLVLAMSADLADSTNISGFSKDFGELENFGRYERNENPEGALLPQEITEFANSGISCGIASTNLSESPEEEFLGFFAACSTYGSFSYLKYGPMRLFSQMTQDTELKCGKVIWVAGHSGPETADDSRTHFGIYGPGVTQLFPEGQCCNLYPWEYNEVLVMLATALRGPWPIIALHLTRPAVEIPDRAAMEMAHHFEASKGAYILRDYKADQPKGGCIFVQGTSSTDNVIKILGELDARKLNVKIVTALSPQLLAAQPDSVRDSIFDAADRWDSTFISNGARRLMSDWCFNPLANQYSMTTDWDDRWRTGGTLDEVIEEAHLDPAHLLEGIERFVADRGERLTRLRREMGSIDD